GSDPGTIGYQGTFEKDVVLEITKYLGELLIEAGAKVVYTRDKDEYVSIFERPEIAIKAGADLFVSVHVNSHLEKGVARGTETLYRAKDPISEVLARTVQDELVEAITLIDRRIWARDDLAIFNGSKIPAVLVEVGFLDHPDEELLLRAPGFQQIAAQGIFNGIERFYLENMN
ncbi:MAG TPA: N-acetylmuramoyl-L-alanine amidase, partial [Natronincola sp.]|nr:N-acetylmuramoyl-L-alanine amidase [Natronincola sp.]